jgi:hypothetical protein
MGNNRCCCDDILAEKEAKIKELEALLKGVRECYEKWKHDDLTTNVETFNCDMWQVIKQIGWHHER